MSGVEVTGFEDLTELLKDMTITDADEKKSMKKALSIAARKVETNTPIRRGKLNKIKIKVKKDGFGTVGTISLGMFYGMFLEYGTSQDKKHVGFFDRSINETTKETLKVLAEELLSKVK